MKPYDPENKIVFATGPINGVATPYGQRFIIASKSPLTDLYFDSVCGEQISAMIKKDGYDALIIEGKASQPLYIYIDEEQISFLDATSLWGLNFRNNEDSQRSTWKQC